MPASLLRTLGIRPAHSASGSGAGEGNGGGGQQQQQQQGGGVQGGEEPPVLVFGLIRSAIISYLLVLGAALWLLLATEFSDLASFIFLAICALFIA